MLLATLPPSVLALVTRFIELEDVVKIGLLSGAGQLWHRMTVLGGVTELLISTKTSARFYLLLQHIGPFSASYASSHNIQREDGLSRWLDAVVAPNIDEYRAIWTRPITAQDDASVRICASKQGDVPLVMRNYFPNLRPFHTEAVDTPDWTSAMLDTDSEAVDEQNWTISMMHYFVRELPATMTSLSLLGGAISPDWPSSSILRF